MNIGDFLGNESAFGRLMTKCGTIIAINVLFAMSCVPFFTIGAAATAMYHALFAMMNAENPINPFREYWQGFRRNFLRATLSWLVFVLIITMGVVNLRICAQWSDWLQYLSVGVIAVLIVTVVVLVYYFPILAAVSAKASELIKLSICIAMSHPLRMLVVLLLNVIPAVLLYVDEINKPTYAFIGTFFGFALIAYVIGRLLVPQFETYLDGDIAE